MSPDRFASAFSEIPLIAILRGISPDEVGEIGSALVSAGFRLIEVPLTSPDPFDSIGRLVRRVGETAVIGAGTVRTEAQLRQLLDVGGSLVVTPHADVRLISSAASLGLATVPGVATPTEAFAVIDAGANAVKVFPASAVPPTSLRAWRTVIPADIALCPTGGVAPEQMAEYVSAGAGGFGIGTVLYQPGFSAHDVRERARAYIDAWKVISLDAK